MSLQAVWIHGVESDNFDPQEIQACADAVTALIQGEKPANTIFNWNVEVANREKIVYDIVKSYGNWLTNKVRKAICYEGSDLWWTMQMLKNGEPAYILADVMERMDEIVMGLFHADKALNLNFICHSWGNYIGLRFLIDHPEVPANMISLS